MERFEEDLRDFVADWKLREQAEHTVRTYCQYLREFDSWCAAQSVQTTSVRAAKRWLVEITDRGQWQAFMGCRALKAFGRWWGEEYGVPDPYADLRYVKQPKERPQRVTTTRDVEALLATCEPDLRGLRDAAIIHVLACTGMRRAEVARMQWSDIDTASGSVVIPQTKNGQPRVVRLSVDAQRALKRYRRMYDAHQLPRDGGVWASLTKQGRALLPNGIGQMIERRAKSAGVDVSAHAFRRGFAVEWLRREGSETYLRHVAGWEDPRMVSRYVRTLAQEEALREHQRLFG